MGATGSHGRKATLMSTGNYSHIQNLVEEFARCIVSQREAMQEGKLEEGNRFSNLASEAFKALTSVYGDDGREVLKTLLRHPDPEVQMATAVCLLRYCTQEALKKLRDIAESGTGHAAAVAPQAIKRWEEGDWHLDPAPADDN